MPSLCSAMKKENQVDNVQRTRKNLPVIVGENFYEITNQCVDDKVGTSLELMRDLYE